jgi:hypothetical protein
VQERAIQNRSVQSPDFEPMELDSHFDANDIEFNAGSPQPSWSPTPHDLEPQVLIVHHPSSKIPDITLPLSLYTKPASRNWQPPPNCELEPILPSDHQNRPWYPFQSYADFDFADFVKKAHLSNPQIDDLLHRHHTTWSDNSHVSFSNHRDIEKLLNRTEGTVTPV